MPFISKISFPKILLLVSFISFSVDSVTSLILAYVWGIQNNWRLGEYIVKSQIKS